MLGLESIVCVVTAPLFLQFEEICMYFRYETVAALVTVIVAKEDKKPEYCL